MSLSERQYRDMLEKYRDINEDEILAGLTDEELQQLEGEINREVLNINNEVHSDSCDLDYSSSEENFSLGENEIESDESLQTKDDVSVKEKTLFKKVGFRSKDDCNKIDEKWEKPSASLQKTRKRPNRVFKRRKSEDVMKRELMMAVKKKNERIAAKANNNKTTKRVDRKQNENNTSQRCRNKITKVSDSKFSSKQKHLNNEILLRKPQLKNVCTREPVKVTEMLHGMSLGHITSNEKLSSSDKTTSGYLANESATPYTNWENNTTPTSNSFLSRQRSSETTLQTDTDISNEKLSSSDKTTSGYLANESATPYTNWEDNTTPTSNSFLSRPRSSEITLQTDIDISNDETLSSVTSGSSSAESYDVIGELSINPNSVEDTMERIRKNDPSLVEINLNNIQNVNMQVFEELATAMESNTSVKSLSLANVGLTDKPARALATMLRRNKTLEELNIESNFITGETALRLVRALRHNQSLAELKLDNQRHIFGTKVEYEFSKILKENKTLLKFGYQFVNPGPRMTASNILTRNMDDVRKKRVQEQRRQTEQSKIGDVKAQRGLCQAPSKNKMLKGKTFHRRLENEEKSEEKTTEELQKVLDQINPDHYHILEKWFSEKLLGQTEKMDDSAVLPKLCAMGRLQKKVCSEESNTESLPNLLQNYERPSTPLPPHHVPCETDYMNSNDHEKSCSNSSGFDIDCQRNISDVTNNEYFCDSKSTDEKSSDIGNDICDNKEDDSFARYQQALPPNFNVPCSSSFYDFGYELDSNDDIDYEKNDDHYYNDDNDADVHDNDDDELVDNVSIVDDDDDLNDDDDYNSGNDVGQGLCSSIYPKTKCIDNDQISSMNRECNIANKTSLSVSVQLPIQHNQLREDQSCDEEIIWKEGDQYDSDEYEIVEVEVTDTEESDSSDIEDHENLSTCGNTSDLKEKEPKQPNLSSICSDFLVPSSYDEVHDDKLTKQHFRSTYETQLNCKPITDFCLSKTSDESTEKDSSIASEWVANRPFYNLEKNKLTN